jgi:LuxR family transcriptional regulator, maltose regulon positive regulatory protein
VLLRQDRTEAAAQLAWSWDLPGSRAQVLLDRGDPSEALAVLEPLSVEVESKGWQDEILRVRLLRALALHAQGMEVEALHVLAEAMAQAEGGGFVRIFLDEGARMARLLSAASDRGLATAYAGRLLAAFAAEKPARESAATESSSSPTATLTDPLSQREREVLGLLAEGLSNQEIGGRLLIAIDTVKNHHRRIFEKLEVKRRTEAIVRGRELGLL